MKRTYVLFALMLTVTASLLSCGNDITTKPQSNSNDVAAKQPNSLEAALNKAADDTGVSVIIISPTTGQVSTMSGQELTKMLSDWQTATRANFARGKQFYDESSATVYWVKQHNTKPAFSYFPDKFMGIEYHAYGFKGVKHGNMVYTMCQKDSVGEICFAADDVTADVTQTENWKNNVTEVYSNLNSAIAQGCAMEEDDAVFKKQVLPQILSEMTAMKLSTTGKLTPTQIASVLRQYTQNKNSISKT